jgi:DNA-binding NarL/FixJ family response regulator
VLADIQMPPAKSDEGIRLAKELRTTHPGIAVVILSQYAEPVYATELLAEGSDGRAYLLKDRVQHRGDLTRAVRAVASGGSVLDPRIVELLLTSARTHDASRFDSLTRREREVLVLLAEGWSNAGIAEQLGITTRAVERHIRSIFSKLDLGDSARHNRRVRAALLYLTEQVG